MLIVTETLLKDNLSFVNDVRMTCVHFIITVIIVMKKKRHYFRTAPNLPTNWFDTVQLKHFP